MSRRLLLMFIIYLLMPALILIATEYHNVKASAGRTATPQARDEEGITALIRAARDGERDNVKALLEQGVDINAKDSGGWTALTYAAAKGDEKIVKMLLDKGANVNAGDKEGYSPLMAAVRYGNTSSAKLLIAAGANVNQQDNIGDTALSVAESQRHGKLAELLKKAGAVDPKSDQKRVADDAKPSVSTRPVLLNMPEPSYTLKARDERIQGIVRARVLVGSDGTAQKVKIITGLPYGLSYQAIDAALQMRFKPATKDGQPTPYWVPVEIEFRLRL